MNTQKIIYILNSGGIGVMPTDTIYGLVGSALLPATVDCIARIKKRNPSKPFIILIGKINDLMLFGIKLTPNTKKVLNKYWPGKVSIILPCSDKKFSYLHCGVKSLAFRLPKKKSLRNLLKNTGPLVAPSANKESWPPAKNIKEARKYFGKAVDFYVDSGVIVSKPSTVIALKNGKVSVLRGSLAK